MGEFMEANFKRSLSLVLKHEGGYVDHPRDPGGATNMGITFATLKAWRGKPITKQDVKNLTLDEAAAIYKEKYWDRIQGDKLPKGLDYALFDFAVNSGPSRAVIFLQECLVVAPDGKLGPITLAAIEKVDVPFLIQRLMDRRLAFLKKLKTWNTFGRGWTNRINGVREEAAKMAGEAPKYDPEPERDPHPTKWQALIEAVVALINAIFGKAK